MPKYLVTITEVITAIYEQTEVEAATQAEAITLAEAMVVNDELDEDNTSTVYTAAVEEVK